jgi:hypothetical protein
MGDLPIEPAAVRQFKLDTVSNLLNRQTVDNFIRSAEAFKLPTVSNLPIDASALYLLAAPKVPAAVRRFIDVAQQFKSDTVADLPTVGSLSEVFGAKFVSDTNLLARGRPPVLHLAEWAPDNRAPIEIIRCRIPSLGGGLTHS